MEAINNKLIKYAWKKKLFIKMNIKISNNECSVGSFYGIATKEIKAV